MTELMLLLFVLSLGICAIYPAYVLCAIACRKRPLVTAPHVPATVPPVSIIIVAYNEVRYIRSKVLSYLSDAAWIEGSELIVVSGGSTDGTAAVLCAFTDHPRVRLLLFPERVTKIDGVNLAVSQARNDILVFSDCRQQMKEGSVQRLVARLSDTSIGTVTATLSDEDVHGRPSLIRRKLNELAWSESAAGSALNLFGALYAQRKSVYRPIPRDIIFDDLFVTVSTLIQGKRLVQDREAIIYDVPFDSYYKGERIERLARGLLLFWHGHRHLIRKLPRATFLRFMMYKYAKLMVPFALPVCLLSAGYLAVACLPGAALIGVLVLMLVVAWRMRRHIVLTARINFHFLLAVLKFYFLKERSTSWQQLRVELNNQTAA